MDIPDFKNWDDAFFYLKDAGLGLEFGEPSYLAAASGKMDLGYTDPSGVWISVKRFPLTPEGLTELKRKLPTLLQSTGVQTQQQTDAQEKKLTPEQEEAKRVQESDGAWLDRVKKHPVTYTMEDGTEVELTAISPSEAGLRKARKDAARVGVELIPVLENIPGLDGDAAGVTWINRREIFTRATSANGRVNRLVADHEVLHAYTAADSNLHFNLLDAIDSAGLRETFQTLYDRAEKRWRARYAGKVDDVTFRFRVENEVLAEARAGNVTILGTGVRRISGIVQKGVKAWEVEWDAAHAGQNPQDVRLSDPNPVDLILRYAERDGRDPEIDFSAYDETDAYSRYSLPQLVDPMYSKLAREVQNFKGEKIGAASAIPYLKGKGVKDEEIKWSGIEAFLDGKKSVTKEELLQYLRDNALRIETETLSGEGGFRDRISGKVFANIAEAKKEAENLARSMGFSASSILTDSFDGGNRVEFYIPGGDDIDLVKVERMGGTARWAEYKLPGGDNYREILFITPGPLRRSWVCLWRCT